MTNEDVIEILNKIILTADFTDEYGDMINTEPYEEAIELAIEALENEPKKGEWIEGKNGTIKCNQCSCEIRYSYLIGNKPQFPKFCCDCGARMEVDNE